MEKFVEINSSGDVVLDKEIISILEPKVAVVKHRRCLTTASGTRLKCVFDKSKIFLIPETVMTSDKALLEATLNRLELEHKERICRGNLVEEFEQLVQKGKELIEQRNIEWQEPEEVVREMREEREMNITESLGDEKY